MTLLMLDPREVIAEGNIRITSGQDNSDLEASIKRQGVLMPVLVRSNGDGQYTLIAGFRRRAAAEVAGVQLPAWEIPEYDWSDADTLEAQFAENGFREAITPVEKAQVTLDQRRLLAMFDDNKNYKLDDDAREYAREQFKRLRKGGLEAAVELRDRFIEQFDRNKNGKLDSSEKPAATQFAIKIAAQLQAANKAEKHEDKRKPKGDRKDKKQAKEAKRLFGG